MIELLRYTRDVLGYDENLIRLSRANNVIQDTNINYIYVDELSSSEIGRSETYNSTSEIMNYSYLEKKVIVFSFYGDNAGVNKNNFILQNKTQKGYELQLKYLIKLSSVISITNLTFDGGSLKGNRIDVTYNISKYNNTNVQILRMDELQLTTITD